MAGQKNHMDTTISRIISSNKKEIAETERQCLERKQQLIRGTCVDLYQMHQQIHINSDL